MRLLLWLLARLMAAAALALAVARILRDLAGRSQPRSNRIQRARAREVLVSLYDRYPQASAAQRRPRGLQAVPLDQIVGTVRHPSQNTADFQPLHQLRGRNWQARWERITRATERLEVLPPIELIKVGDEYFVADGHNRLAAALAVGAIAIDADVTELVLPGMQSGPIPPSISTSLVGTDEVRQAGTGRLSRTAEHRIGADVVTRRDLLRASGENPRPAGEETEVYPVVEEEAAESDGASSRPHEDQGEPEA